MDIEKLIERLYKHHTDWGEGRTQDFFEVCLDCKEAATALSTLQAENEKLRADVVRFNDMLASYQNVLVPELRAEQEQVKRERDAAVSWAQKYTESIDRPCVACKHNTGDYVCTAICGNCGPMGTESCKWEFDFSGELKED